MISKHSQELYQEIINTIYETNPKGNWAINISDEDISGKIIEEQNKAGNKIKLFSARL